MISRLVFKLIPFPKKFLSFIPPPVATPLVPKPADKEISPVGCSSTVISKILRLTFEPSLISDLTVLKILRDLISLIDLLNKRLLSGSPSSTINLFLITSSIVE